MRALQFCNFSLVQKASEMHKLPGMPADFGFTMVNLFGGAYPWLIKYENQKAAIIAARLLKNYFLMLKGVKLASFLSKLLASIQYDCNKIEQIQTIGMCLISKFSKGKYLRDYEVRLYILYARMYMAYGFDRFSMTEERNLMIAEAHFLTVRANWPNNLFLLAYFANTMAGLLQDDAATALEFFARASPTHRFNVALVSNNFQRRIRENKLIRHFRNYFQAFVLKWQ